MTAAITFLLGICFGCALCERHVARIRAFAEQQRQQAIVSRARAIGHASAAGRRAAIVGQRLTEESDICRQDKTNAVA